eukprot:2908871-Rhodomonas_salina.1
MHREREVGGGRLDCKAIYRGLLLFNMPRGHAEAGLRDGLLPLLPLRMGKIDRGKQRAHEVRHAEGRGIGCTVGGLHGWRSLWSVEQGTPLM